MKKTAIKSFSFFLALIMALSAFSLCAYAAEEVKFGNQKQQYNSQYAEFNFHADKSVKLKYNYEAEKFNVYYSAKSIAKKGKVLFSVKKATELAIFKDWVYYVNYSKGAIMRCKISDKSKQTLVKFDKNKVFFVNFIIDKKNSKLIYNLMPEYGLKTAQLYVASLNGKNKMKVSNRAKQHFFTNGKNLYYIRDNNLLKYNYDSKKSTVVKVNMYFKDAELIGMEGNNLYLYFSDDYTLDYYRVNVKDKKIKLLATPEAFGDDGAIISTIIYKNSIYVLTGTGAGCGFAKVNNKTGKFNYAPYDYNCLSEYFGYYKNSIAVEEADFVNGQNNYYKTIVNLK